MRAGLLDNHLSRAPDRTAWWVGLGFAVFGALWVLLSDLFLYWFVSDPRALARLETAKGWAFVAASAAFVYLITWRAVRPLRKTEATLRAVLRSISDGVFLIGRDSTIADANPAARRMLGTPDLVGVDSAEFSRRFCLSYLDGRLVAPRDYISQRALRGEVLPPYKAVLQTAAGRRAVIITTAAPVSVAPGEPANLAVSVMHDITALDDLDRTRNEFFASAAHAFKTPLATLKSYAQLMTSHTDSAVRDLVAVLDRQCGRMDRAVQNLQILARIRDGTLKLHPSDLELAPLVREVVNDMCKATREHALTAHIEAQAATFADGERASLMIRNLVEVAFLSAVPGSDVEVVLRVREVRAHVGVRYRPMAQMLAAIELERDVEYQTGLSIGRHVNEFLISAFGGELRTERERDQVVDWVDLPRRDRARS